MAERDGRYVKVDLDREECEVVALMCDAIEQVARMRGMNSAQEQLTRVAMMRVRHKMNIAASLFTGDQKLTDFEIQKSLPPWLQKK